MITADLIHAALEKAGITVSSVSIGNPFNITTWRIVPDSPEARNLIASRSISMWQRDAGMGKLRQLRNAKLAASDWTQLADSPATIQNAWAVYRQALRDLPATTADPINPTWPKEPK